jgi:hypothetical protein
MLGRGAAGPDVPRPHQIDEGALKPGVRDRARALGALGWNTLGVPVDSSNYLATLSI